ncbi:MAG: Rid family hydrolase [Sphingobacteriales bacterium]|nr:Rid family hydrolase [Sphingobacteriales bacterium]
MHNRFFFKKIETVLREAGASMNDVVRTRMFVTDIKNWEEAGKAHALFFSNIQPAATLIQISKLISDDLLIEIEVTAILPG